MWSRTIQNHPKESTLYYNPAGPNGERLHNCHKFVWIGKTGHPYTKESHLSPIETHISLVPECQEIVITELKLGAKDKLMITWVYRSQGSSRENDIKLNYMIRNISQMGYSQILIVGDFNHPEIAWDKGGTVTKNSLAATEFLDAINDSNLSQHIEFATRHRQDQTSNVLDLVITGQESMIEEINEEAPLGKRDHAVIKMKLRCYPDALTTTQTRYLYEKAGYKSMKKLVKCNWATMFDKLNTKENQKIFCDKLEKSIEAHIPKKKCKPGGTQRPKWMNQREILGMIRNKCRTYKKWRSLKLTYLMKPMHGLETTHNGQLERLWKHMRKILHRK